MKLNNISVFKILLLTALFLCGIRLLLAQEFAGGQGSEADPWQIETAEHLNNVRNYLGEAHGDKHFIQTANINLTGFLWDDGAGDYINNGEGWQPLGAETNRFTGQYDGGGYSISNLYINRPEGNYQGMFGYTDNATIKNFSLENVNIRGRQNVGSLVAYALRSNIIDVHSAVQIIGQDDVGGLIGCMDGSYVYNTSSVSEVIGSDNVGGLIGYTGNTTSYVYHSHSIGSVEGSSQVGGLIGYMRNSDIVDCYSRASVSGNIRRIGGFAGYLYHSSGRITTSYSTGLVTGTGSDIGGFIGRYTSGSAKHCYWDRETSERETSAGGEGVSGKTTAEMQQQATYNYYNFLSLWEINDGNDYPVFQDLSDYALPQPVSVTDLAGAGTAEDPYIITTADELNAVRQDLAAYYLLENDIDMCRTIVWNEGRGWDPIGSSDEGNRFTGSFDGGGYAITGLHICRPRANHQGVFGFIQGATIRNLRLEDNYIQGNQYVGSLVAYASRSNILNVHSAGQVMGQDDLGGLIGWMDGSYVYNTSTVSKVLGGDNVGGLIGYTHDNFSAVYHSYALGSVEGSSQVGGLIGYMRNSDIVDCYSRASVSGNIRRIGGFAGYLYHSSGRITTSYSTGLVTGTGSDTGGFLGRLSSGTIEYCYWDTETSGRETSAGGAGVSGKTTAEMQQQATYNYYNFLSLWEINEGNDYPVFQDLSDYALPQPVSVTDLAGAGTAEDPYIITTADELNAVRQDLAAYYLLNNDIDMRRTIVWNEGRGWDPIGSSEEGNRFTGSFDGGGYAITGLHVCRPRGNHQGVFGFIQGATIRNLRLEDNYIQGNQYVGCLVAYALGSNILNVHSAGQIMGQDDVGGLIGWMNGSYVYNTSSVSEVIGSGNVGGLIGYTGNTTSYVYHSYSAGSVVASASNVGGFIGHRRNTDILDCYSRASVSGISNVGGFAGYLYNSAGKIRSCYSTGYVTGTVSYIGGFLGRLSSGTIEYCYWDTETSGRETSAGGAGVSGKTTAEMQQQATYNYYNFLSLWEINEGNDYPVFQDLSDYALPQPVSVTDLAGAGTAEDPYIITTADELNAVRQDLAAYYLLNNDIDMRRTIVWNEGRGWDPIGSSEEGNRFTGSFDGGCYAITGLHICRPRANHQGVFGFPQGASIKNLRLEDTYIQGNQYVGCLVAYALGSNILNVHSAGQVMGQDDLGGLIGWMDGSYVYNTSSVSEVLGRENVGGLIGYTGNITSYVYHSYSAGSVVASASNVGGFIGHRRNTDIFDCYSRASVSGTSNVGGFAGYLYNSAGKIRSCYSTGYVTGTVSYIGGFLGRLSSGTIEYCYWDTETSERETSAGGAGVSGKTTAEMQQQATYNYYNFLSLWEINDGNDYPVFQDLSDYALPQPVSVTDLAGAGTAEDPYIITTADELNAVRQDLAAYYLLENDIDMCRTIVWNEGRGWDPIGSSEEGNRFTGSFDGGGYAITGLHICRPRADYQGVFGFTQGATIRNLRLEDTYIQGNQYVGCLVAYALGSNILNVHSAGQVMGQDDLGGLIGWMDGSYVYKTSTVSEVLGRENVGGLIGYAGTTSSSVYHSHSTGSVVASASHIGGFIGYQRNADILDCYSRASVSGISRVGGFAGYLYHTSGRILTSYSTGLVTGTGADVGGFIGRHASGTVEHCYWDMYTSGQETSAGGAGLMGRTSAQMTYPYDEDTYVGWDFEDIWIADNLGTENNGYPCLRWQIGSDPFTAINPSPAQDSIGVALPIEELRWTYPANLMYAIPAGFRVYFNQTGEFDENDDYVWVDYEEGQENYSCRDILPELQPATRYYWMIVPTTIEPNDDGRGHSRQRRLQLLASRTGSVSCPYKSERGDAEDVSVWSFVTITTTPFVDDFSIDYNWQFANGEAVNRWVIDEATAYSDDNSAYISNDEGESNAYNVNRASIVHIYRDILFCDDAHDFYLTFKWKGMGEGIPHNRLYDYMQIHIINSENIPQAGELITEGAIGRNYLMQEEWTLENIYLPAENYAGQVKRLVFTWINNEEFGEQPPIAIDDIAMIKIYPDPVTAVNPFPVADSINVTANLDSLKWSYIVDSTHVNPLGFRVYFNRTDEFGDDYEWIPYIEEQERYSATEILPERLEYGIRYYWKVVPTTIDGSDDRSDSRIRRHNDRTLQRYNPTIRGDAQNCPVWSFVTVYPEMHLLSEDSLSFGEVYLGDTSDTLQVWIKNTGTETMVVDSLSFYQEQSHYNITDSELPIEIAIDDSTSISLLFQPRTVGVLNDSLYIFSDAVNIPVLSIRLTGRCDYVPPKSPENVRIVLDDYDAVISWDEVTETIYDTPIEVDCYIVLYNEVADDDDELFNFLANTTDLTHTHYEVAMFREKMFYRVVAIRFRNRERSSIFEDERLYEDRVTWGELKKILRGEIVDRTIGR